MGVAAHHVGDLHVEVVDDHGEVVGRIAVGTEDHQVVELAVGDLDPALDLVVPGDDAAERVLQADYAVGIVAMRRVLLAESAVVARLLRSEEHTSELQSLMRISYAVFCLKKKKK